MMESIGSVTKNDTPCELFSDTIMGQLEELEGHILLYWVLNLYPTSRLTPTMLRQPVEKI